MITSDTYDRDIDALRSKIGRLQADLSEVIGAVGTISGHGLEDLREEAAAGAETLQRQSRQVQAAITRGVTDLESSFEGSVRSQPLLAVALAAGIGFVLSQMVLRH